MPKRRNPQLILAAVLLAAFIAGMLALTFLLGGGSAQEGGGAAPAPAPVGEMGPGEIQRGPGGNNRYDGRFLNFKVPSGAKDFSREVNGEVESASFTVDDTNVSVTTQPAPAGLSLQMIAQNYGSAARPSTLNGDPVYEVRSDIGGQASTLIINYEDGRWVFVQASGPSESASASRKFARSFTSQLDVAERNSLLLERDK